MHPVMWKNPRNGAQNGSARTTHPWFSGSHWNRPMFTRWVNSQNDPSVVQWFSLEPSEVHKVSDQPELPIHGSVILTGAVWGSQGQWSARTTHPWFSDSHWSRLRFTRSVISQNYPSMVQWFSLEPSEVHKVSDQPELPLHGSVVLTGAVWGSQGQWSARTTHPWFSDSHWSRLRFTRSVISQNYPSMVQWFSLEPSEVHTVSDQPELPIHGSVVLTGTVRGSQGQ